MSNKDAANATMWPHSKPSLPSINDAGFRMKENHDGVSDLVSCRMPSCGLLIHSWTSSMDPHIEHLTRSPTCSWARVVCAFRIDSTMSSLTARKRQQLRNVMDVIHASRDMSSEEVTAWRVDTFHGWIHAKKRRWKPTALALAKAGFVYDPYDEQSDNARCVYGCDVRIDEWNATDDPMQEHEKKSPTCPFILHFHDKHGAAASFQVIGEMNGDADKDVSLVKSHQRQTSRASKANPVATIDADSTSHSNASTSHSTMRNVLKKADKTTTAAFTISESDSDMETITPLNSADLNMTVREWLTQEAKNMFKSLETKLDGDLAAFEASLAMATNSLER